MRADEFTLTDAVEPQKVKLTSRFVVTGLIASISIVLVITILGYYSYRTYGVEVASKNLYNEVNGIIGELRRTASLPKAEGDSSGADQEPVSLWADSRLVNRAGFTMKRLTKLNNARLLNLDGSVKWPVQSTLSLSQGEREALKSIRDNADYVAMDDNFMEFNSWRKVFGSNQRVLPVFVKLKDNQNRPIGIAKLDLNFKLVLDASRGFALLLMVFLFLANGILFLMLYYNFRKGIKTIERQEEKMNHQITRLSNLLTINKTMQKSMKTASARAVELNEQFLRRVGADLHDGPAQMVGFAVLRLNQVSKQEAAKQLSHEFHAVREALDESLEEIRGISSGLVLPQLEQMNLEECLRKVVVLHGAKSDAEIAQYYQDLPDDMPLPIKICAYRFVQEGLNNAHRHGAAKKCRLSAQFKNDELTVSLKDNGMGFRTSKLNVAGGHLGLLGLKDRVESLGGKFSINSELGTGTALKFTINLAEDT